MTRMGFDVSDVHGTGGFAWLPEKHLWCILITSSIDTKPPGSNDDYKEWGVLCVFGKSGF